MITTSLLYMKYKILIILAVIGIAVIGALVYAPPSTSARKKVTITIGYQIPTAQTWSATVITQKKLYEKYLTEADPSKDYTVVWENFTSGPPITTNMIANKIQIGFMGDMPLLVNASKGQEMDNYDSVIIAFDGKGAGGKNQAIMTNKANNYSIQDLKGKQVSTIFGSSAHRMLLAVLKKNNLLDQVEIVNQDVTTGMAAVEENKIAAHATWDPYPRYMVQRGKAKVLADGSESGGDYLAGVVVNKKWADANRTYTVAFLKALEEAHSFIKTSPDDAARIFSTQTKFPSEVCMEEDLSIHWESEITNRDMETLAADAEFLKSVGKIQTIRVEDAIDRSFYEAAVR